MCYFEFKAKSLISSDIFNIYPRNATFLLSGVYFKSRAGEGIIEDLDV